MSRSVDNLFTGAPTSRRALLVVLAVTAAGGAIAGCSGGSSATSTSPGTSAQATSAPSGASTPAKSVPAATPKTDAASTTAIVKMTDQFKFDPEEITIAKGATVEWQNTSSQPHTVTDDPSKAMDKAHAVLPNGADPWDSGIIETGKSFKRTFTVAGDYTYLCTPHEAMGMVGKIKVS